jgi:hypothetical protein
VEWEDQNDHEVLQGKCKSKMKVGDCPQWIQKKFQKYMKLLIILELKTHWYLQK